jgi:SAM-dependent methyltransferase
MTRRLKALRRRLAAIPALGSAVRAVRSMVLPQQRMIRRLQANQGAALLQPFPNTSPDRHPALFAFAQARLAGRRDVRLLSFGCSTGEEPLTLHRYLPEAAIDAIDINPRSVASARANAARQGCTQIAFTVGAAPVRGAEPYDAVFCLSVLRHGQLDSERPQSCRAIFPFAKYEAALTALDQALHPGGVLFIWGSHFRFADSVLADRYRPLDVPGMRQQTGIVYGPDDLRLESAKVSQFAFEKLR